MRINQNLKKALFGVIFMAFILTFTLNVKAVCTIGSNLILNGDAETDSTFAGGGFTDHDLTNWNPETGGFTVVRYTAGGGFPTVSDPGPVNRGTFFFVGGNGGAASGMQVVNITDCASNIDANLQPYDVSGFFGGFSTQADTSALTLNFKNSANTTISSVTIGNVTPAERGNVTGMILRTTAGLLTPGTRTVEVVLSMPASGGYNDGYADNLSFILNAPTAANASISGRILTADGNGIRNVNVSLVRSNGEVFSAKTGTFGYYKFEDLEVGQTYVLSVLAKRYTFANPTRIINLSEDLTDADFVSDLK